MFSKKIIRWSGIALAMGGVLAALFYILHPEESVLLTNPVAFQSEHLLDFIGLMLLIPGIMGLYAHLSNQTGWLGFAGFLLSLVSLLVLMGISVVDFLIWPSIAQIQPDLILTAEREFVQSSGPFAIIGALGFILFGIAIRRSGRLPRAAGLLLAIGGPLCSIGLGFVPHNALLLNLTVYLPFAVTALWLGVSLLNQSERQQESMPLSAGQAS